MLRRRAAHDTVGLWVWGWGLGKGVKKRVLMHTETHIYTHARGLLPPFSYN